VSDDPTPKTVHIFARRPELLESKIRALAQDSSNVLIPTDHSLERQDERGITDKMIFDALRAGYIEDVRPGKGVGEWKCKMTKRVKGRREVGVVTVLLAGDSLLVATVEWEDMR
tara:strand:- start:246 stop:587 length:342 start_codon:yes stop_codon:yes gene_type:complete